MPAQPFAAVVEQLGLARAGSDWERGRLIAAHLVAAAKTGNAARADLAIDEADLREALNAAHQIGDDALGQSNESQFTHGSSAQRMTWFRRGFDSGDARQCDTFNVPAGQL